MAKKNRKRAPQQSPASPKVSEGLSSISEPQLTSTSEQSQLSTTNSAKQQRKGKRK
ncbi:MAG: hypothetical protein FWG30_00895 [Eubacteriaceae bacterium]|nr:hypothetical protein [Eubacteriaceae bacterium]